ncbi:hypothetical protein QOT17_003273 [Balamuthia mandrillaris]
MADITSSALEEQRLAKTIERAELRKKGGTVAPHPLSSSGSIPAVKPQRAPETSRTEDSGTTKSGRFQRQLTEEELQKMLLEERRREEERLALLRKEEEQKRRRKEWDRKTKPWLYLLEDPSLVEQKYVSQQPNPPQQQEGKKEVQPRSNERTVLNNAEVMPDRQRHKEKEKEKAENAKQTRIVEMDDVDAAQKELDVLLASIEAEAITASSSFSAISPTSSSSFAAATASSSPFLSSSFPSSSSPYLSSPSSSSYSSAFSFTTDGHNWEDQSCIPAEELSQHHVLTKADAEKELKGDMMKRGWCVRKSVLSDAPSLVIAKEWHLDGFNSCISFFNRVVKVAAREKHHPTVILQEGRGVMVELYTAELGAITVNDLVLAYKMDNLPVLL